VVQRLLKIEGDVLGGCHLYPNPATGHIKLNIDLDQNKRVEVKLFNSIGEQVNGSLNAEGIQGANTYTLDIATLPEGIYFAQINLDGVLATTQRFIVTK
jgi:type IX secretion system substrate protein